MNSKKAASTKVITKITPSGAWVLERDIQPLESEQN